MYYLLLIAAYAVSLLPLRVLYILSDGLYMLVYRVARYRRAVVNDNLLQAFPEKTPAERTAIAERYYRHLADMIVETIKLLTMSRKNLHRRFRCDLSLLQALYERGKSCQLHLGHNFNWEWANLFCMQGVPYPFLVVYMPVTNKAVNRLFLHFRKKAGSRLIPANDMKNAMEPWKGKQYLLALVADQNPGKVRRAYWYPFLNRMTAFYKGPEMGARRNDIPVVFVNIRKVKRGYYEAALHLAFEDPAAEPEGKITETFVHFLEKNIREQPDTWVWSHRRWKHRYPGQP